MPLASSAKRLLCAHSRERERESEVMKRNVRSVAAVTWRPDSWHICKCVYLFAERRAAEKWRKGAFLMHPHLYIYIWMKMNKNSGSSLCLVDVFFFIIFFSLFSFTSNTRDKLARTMTKPKSASGVFFSSSPQSAASRDVREGRGRESVRRRRRRRREFAAFRGRATNRTAAKSRAA